MLGAATLRILCFYDCGADLNDVDCMAGVRLRTQLARERPRTQAITRGHVGAGGRGQAWHELPIAAAHAHDRAVDVCGRHIAQLLPAHPIA